MVKFDVSTDFRVTLHMGIDYESGQGIVLFLIHFVLDHCQNVKSGEDGVSEINVIYEVKGTVVGALERVGSCDDGATSLQRSHNTCLGYGD